MWNFVLCFHYWMTFKCSMGHWWGNTTLYNHLNLELNSVIYRNTMLIYSEFFMNWIAMKMKKGWFFVSFETLPRGFHLGIVTLVDWWHSPCQFWIVSITWLHQATVEALTFTWFAIQTHTGVCITLHVC